MKVKLLILVLVFTFFPKLNAQDLIIDGPRKHNITFIPQGYPYSNLSGYGNSGLYNNVANIGSMNPAAIFSFDKYEIGISYQFENKLSKSWVLDIPGERFNNSIPQSFGLIIPTESFRFGISLHQKYNRNLIWTDSFSFVTPHARNDEINKFIEPENGTMVNSVLGSASYEINNCEKSLSIAFGIRGGLSIVQSIEKRFNEEYSDYLYGSELALGTVLTIKNVNKQIYSLGLSYQFKSHTDKMIERKTDLNNIFDHSSFVPLIDRIKKIVKLPSRLNFDFFTKQNDKLSLLGGASIAIFDNTAHTEAKLLDIYGSIISSFNDVVKASIGVIYTETSFQQKNVFKLFNELDALFITMGTEINYSNFNLHLVLADSHIISGKFRKQTIFKTMLSYSF